MIETALFQNTETAPKQVKNDRTAGTMPVWQPKNTEKALNFTENAQITQKTAHITENKDENLGFNDFIDMINPLHHLPIVGEIYRNITGDDIKPISKLVGGTAFGGPMGLASNLADIIIKEETGFDIAQHATNLFTGDKASETEKTLTAIAQNKQTTDPDMTRTLLSFSDLSYQNDITIEKKPASNNRTAGDIHHYNETSTPLNTTINQREPITEITLKPMPKRTSYNG